MPDKWSTQFFRIFAKPTPIRSAAEALPAIPTDEEIEQSRERRSRRAALSLEVDEARQAWQQSEQLTARLKLLYVEKLAEYDPAFVRTLTEQGMIPTSGEDVTR